MTVIAWDGESLAADRQANESGLRHTTTKIKRIEKGKFKGCLMGAAGSVSQGLVMMSWFESGADPSFFPQYQDSDDTAAQLVVITKDKEILRFDFNPIPIVFHDDKYAIGSGRDLAIGAMAMGADATRAVEVAIQFDTGCGMGINVIPFKSRKVRRGN